MAICKTVVTLLINAGFISYFTDIMYKTRIPSVMIKSLLITKTVSQLGISPIMAKVMYIEERSNLSASGSIKAPTVVCLLNARAMTPSKTSVNPAIPKVTSASKYISWSRKMIITGTKTMRNTDKKLGIFII